MDSAARDQDRDQPAPDTGSASEASPRSLGLSPGHGDPVDPRDRQLARVESGSRGRRRNRRRSQANPDETARSSAERDPSQPGSPASSPAPVRKALPRQPQSGTSRSAPAPDASVSRPNDLRGGERRGATDSRPRRTNGTRPPEPGNGRGLSGSPRNPNAYGEVPIRPDNGTFDDRYDRQVCIARSHIIPEEFPVLFRRMTAARRLSVVTTTGAEVLYCDLGHTGPHIWPDQTVVTTGSRGDDAPVAIPS